MFDVHVIHDLLVQTFGSCVFIKTGVIKMPLKQYVRFFAFLKTFFKIQKT